MGDLQVQEVKEEQKNNELLWTIEKVINDDIFAPEYEPPDEIFNRRKYMLTKKKKSTLIFLPRSPLPCLRHC